MRVASEQPHFLAVDDDALGTGVVIYHLQVHVAGENSQVFCACVYEY